MRVIPKKDLFSNSDVRPDDSVPTGGHRGVNLLNNLNTREWLLSTKSVWYSKLNDLRIPALEQATESLRKTVGDIEAENILGQLFDSIMLSRTPPRDALKAQHPATFSEPDIERLIKFFTKENELVLDPFVGSGSTLVACQRCGRNGIGIELTKKWAELSRERTNSKQHSMFSDVTGRVEVRHGDALTELRSIKNQSVQFIVTSPPYWSVLNKPADHKVKDERLRKGLPTRYSDDKTDLGNARTYAEFLRSLESILKECCRVLADKRYIAVVVSDFRDKSKFYLFHADIAKMLEHIGFDISGVTILVQDSKTLYPYGMPYAFVSNIHHQYVVIARKIGKPSRKIMNGK